MEIQTIPSLDYDKISDDICYLGNLIYLRFNVTLAKKSKEGQRIFFQKDAKYPSKYTDYEKVITMRRNFDYYLTFEKVDDYTSSTMITAKDIILLRIKTKEVITWFSNGVFQIKDGDIKIIRKPQSVVIDTLAGGKSIIIDPVIYIDRMTNLQQMGVRFAIGDGSTYVDINVDKFYEIYYHIHSINMYECAVGLLNFIGRSQTQATFKEYDGFNSVFIDEQEEPEIKIKNRQPASTRKSFFDKGNQKTDDLDNL